ncbi:hypothetical protein ABGV42_01510 [Paenibacillus pabuli]|uniref:hypothetical protein n=1 Tax=Paenibacillus pabuli TaxID=1472 RepID=UPI0032420252
MSKIDALDYLESLTPYQINYILAKIGMGYDVAPTEIEGRGVIIVGQNALQVFNPLDEMSDAFALVQTFGIVVIPQSTDDGGFNWYAMDIDHVSYRGSEVAIAEGYDSSYSDETYQVAVTNCALLSLYNRGLIEIEV